MNRKLRKIIREESLARSRRKRRAVVFSVLTILIVAAIITLAIYWMNRPSQLSHSGEECSLSIVDSDPASIPDYSGEDWIELNGGIPGFNARDLECISGENYSELDDLGRCGTAVALLDRSMMPVQPRGEIGQIRPSGWHQTKYEGLIDSDPPYLYNRCHLIAYALTGQNANECNLITGTGYMNFHIMLPWEQQVMKYLEDTPYHVLYRVSPYFKGKEMLARGVEMEAYSVEDKGKTICFHVFIYNIQPGIVLDYKTGDSRAE